MSPTGPWCAESPAAHLQVGLLQPVIHQLRVALLLLQLLLQLCDAGLQAPLLLQRQSTGEWRGGGGERGRTRAGNPAPAPARARAGSPFAAAVGHLVGQLVPLLLGLALGALGSCQVLPREPECDPPGPPAANSPPLFPAL